MAEISQKKLAVKYNCYIRTIKQLITIGNVMKNLIKTLMLPIAALLLMQGCASVKSVTSYGNGHIADYKYFCVTPASDIYSTTGIYLGDEYLMIGNTVTRSGNPADMIAGELIKKGLIRLPEPHPDLIDKTLIVSYGVSGMKFLSAEMTMQFISAIDMEVLSVCTVKCSGGDDPVTVNRAIRRGVEAMVKSLN